MRREISGSTSLTPQNGAGQCSVPRKDGAGEFSGKCQHFPGKIGFLSGCKWIVFTQNRFSRTLHATIIRSTFKVHTPVFLGP